MSIVFIQLQNTAQQGVTLLPGSIVLFDGVPLKQSDPEDISYDPSTGRIRLHQAGVYYVDWSIVSDSASGPVELSIITTEGQELQSGSPLTKDEVAGFGIITVTVPDTELYLRNGLNDFQYAATAITANLSIHSLDMGSTELADKAAAGIKAIAGRRGSVINMSNGKIDITNPLTWPILLDVLQISLIQGQASEMQDVFTPAGLEELLGLPIGIISNPLVGGIVSIPLAAVQVAVAALAAPLADAFQCTANVGLFSVDTYIGHAGCGIVPAIAGADLPILSLVAGPPYPHIIARDGSIISFAAGYDSIAEVDLSLINALPGIIMTLNNVIVTILDAVAVLISAIGSIASVLLGLGAPLPSDYADRLNAKRIQQMNEGIPSTNHHVHAVLWHGTPDSAEALGGLVNWESVADLDLGAVHWLEIGLLDSAISILGDVIAAGGNVASMLLTLLGSRGTRNQALNTAPINVNLIGGLDHPVSAGDYLMVQFTLAGSDNTTIIAGVLASTLMASIEIA